MEGTLMIKSYRGLLTDGGQDKIRLTTTDGRVGYRIVKFQIMPKQPGNVAQESVVQIWTKQLATVPTSSQTINFTDSDLLAAGIGMYGGLSGNTVPFLETIIFDKQVFNQDIYITHTDNESTQDINYYIELEQIKLSSAQAELLIVKSLRGEVWTRP